jgi:hypothetical protein
MQSELARAVGRRACGVGSPCWARGSSSCRRDACRVGWVLCTPQGMASAPTAREPWRRRSRRTRRSRRSTSKVRGSVLAVAGRGGCVARSHGRRPRAGARCRASSRVQLGGARAASGPLAGRVAPPLVGVTLAVWVGCCARRRQWHRRRRRESSGGLAREEHDAQGAQPQTCAALCSRWLGRGDVARSHGRRPRAGARCRASSRVQLGGARAASGPLAGRVTPLLVGVTLAVWVGWCARRRQWHRRRRRESSGGLAREEHDARDALPHECASLCSRWLGNGGMWRGPTAGGRARAHDAERARACSWAARVRRQVPLPGAWLLFLSA